jgi:hypothetical protein
MSTQAEDLIELAEAVEFFYTSDGRAYAAFPVNGHREICRVRQSAFRLWLVKSFYEANGKPPTKQALESALATLEARARYDGELQQVFVRLAEHGDCIYLDLGGASREAVKVTAQGWAVISNPPVRFLRPRGLTELPRPTRGDRLDDLLKGVVNVASPVDRALLAAWLVMALNPCGPYPVLVLQGEQGSAKSTVTRVIRAIVDASSAPLRTPPRDERDLMIAAANSWILAFDNLATLTGWLSDAICRLATGGGFSTRELYSDDDEIIFDARRPVILNGIEDLAARDDLRDRAVILTLQPIAEAIRRDEKMLWADINAALPRMLGALLDGVSAALSRRGEVRLPVLPRMADFVRWAVAAEPALGLREGSFLEAYLGNRQAAIEASVEFNPVARAIRELALEEWQGTATELLDMLASRVPVQERDAKAWPRSGRGMSGALRRAAPGLRALGIDIQFGDRESTPARRRLIRVRQLRQPTVQTVQPDQPEAERGLLGGRTVDGRSSSVELPAYGEDVDRQGPGRGAVDLDGQDDPEPPFLPDLWEGAPQLAGGRATGADES